MFNILKAAISVPISYVPKSTSISSVRTFLSHAYYCNEVWEHRLSNPIISKVNVEELFQELDQKYTKTGQISAVDVDVFANAVNDETYIDELLDLTHKLRLSASTSKTLESTPHAVVRFLMKHNKYEELIKIINDRLNYGIFLDNYTANILMDILYKNDDFMIGSRVAQQFMLQEDFSHPVTVNLGLLHCYKHLLNPKPWPEDPQPEEPEEEIKIRVNYLRNPYFDDHFDLREPRKIIGKTLWMSTKGKNNILDDTLYLLGLDLHGKKDKVDETLKQFSNRKLYAELLSLLPEDSVIKKSDANVTEPGNIESLLSDRVKEAERECAEKDIAIQCEKFSKWEVERKEAIEKQHERLMVQEKLANIENIQKDLKERETKLWFFENEEKIELAIQAKKVFYPKRWFGKKKTPKATDEAYVPPEIR